MLKVVTGLALLTRVDVKRPMAPKRRFNNSVYSERTKNALMLKGGRLNQSHTDKTCQRSDKVQQKNIYNEFQSWMNLAIKD